ncbi:hypothetical protein PP744_gp020 [Rhizobium phage RHph_N38]|uniref:Uncharacterized protein n=1 Tax=Rhizobium phage RHph_N38 TaxID=2509750 RepID=A0A7S5R3D3_9CAUD|nr:hypothetical protein PP744_gp020 [Rhizobium phage RHph_N38]QIG70483.1 hypothetical protein EVB89_020 [Rhizobium phage RHph_N38]
MRETNIPNIIPAVGISIERNQDGSTMDLILGRDDILYICDCERNGRIIDSSELFEISQKRLDSLIYALQKMKTFAK